MDKDTEKKWDGIVHHTEWHYRKGYKAIYGRATTTRSKLPYPYNLLLDIELFLAFVIDNYNVKKPQEPININKLYEKLSDEEKSLLFEYYHDEKKQVNICKGFSKKRDNIFRKLHKEIIEKQEQEKIKERKQNKIWIINRGEVKTGDIVNSGMSNRTTNALMRAEIFSIDELITTELSELKKIKGIGSFSIEEIKAFICHMKHMSYMSY